MDTTKIGAYCSCVNCESLYLVYDPITTQGDLLCLRCLYIGSRVASDGGRFKEHMAELEAPL